MEKDVREGTWYASSRDGIICIETREGIEGGEIREYTWTARCKIHSGQSLALSVV